MKNLWYAFIDKYAVFVCIGLGVVAYFALGMSEVSSNDLWVL